MSGRDAKLLEKCERCILIDGWDDNFPCNCTRKDPETGKGWRMSCCPCGNSEFAEGQENYEICDFTGYRCRGQKIPCDCYKNLKAYRDNNPCTCKYEDITPCLWATIRPPGDVPEILFIDRLRKVMKSSLIIRGFLSFEWKHNDQENKGIHAHIWAEEDLRRIKYHIKRSCKGWNTKNKTCPRKWFEEKLDYVNGITWDDEKDKMKQKLDVERRNELGMENVEMKNYLTF